jgi:hypothetical protein
LISVGIEAVVARRRDQVRRVGQDRLRELRDLFWGLRIRVSGSAVERIWNTHKTVRRVGGGRLRELWHLFRGFGIRVLGLWMSELRDLVLELLIRV